MRTSETKRISKELSEEIERVSKKNELKFVQASREIARLIRNNRNTKLKREIQF